MLSRKCLKLNGSKALAVIRCKSVYNTVKFASSNSFGCLGNRNVISVIIFPSNLSNIYNKFDFENFIYNLS